MKNVTATATLNYLAPVSIPFRELAQRKCAGVASVPLQRTVKSKIHLKIYSVSIMPGNVPIFSVKQCKFCKIIRLVHLRCHVVNEKIVVIIQIRK